jgi:hypothetical protein
MSEEGESKSFKGRLHDRGSADILHFRHFYAHEHPDLLARDVKIMFGKGGGGYGLIAGKDGYEIEEQ